MRNQAASTHAFILTLVEWTVAYAAFGEMHASSYEEAGGLVRHTLNRMGSREGNG